MIALITVIALFLALMLLFLSKQTFKGNFYLAAFFFSLGLWGFMMQLVAFSDSDFWAPLLFGHINPFMFLIGPFLFLYVRSVVTTNAAFTYSDLIHFIIPVLILINTLPYYSVDFETKKELIFKIRENKFYPDLGNYSLWFPFNNTQILRPVILYLYTLGSILYLRKKRTMFNTSKQTLGIPSDKLFKWLRLQLYVISFYSLINIVLSLFLFGVLPRIELVDFQSIGAFAKLTILISLIGFFFVPSIIYGIPHKEVYKVEPETKSPEKLLLYDEEYLTKIEKEVDRIVNEGLMLREDFAIGILAKEINVAEHHLTYYFNHVVEMKFTDWKNQLRVDFAKKKIAEGYLKNGTAEQLAKASGYSHQSTFYAVFKKMTNVTPGEYERILLSDKKNSANV